MRLHCFKKRAFNKFSWEQKRRVKKYFDGKRIWKTREKFKFWFIQKPWIYVLVKSRNSQIIYIINIMTFSKFAQEIYFYLIVASFYLIRSKLKIFIHSFISCQLPCSIERLQVKVFWRFPFLLCRLMKRIMERDIYYKTAKSRTSHLQVFCKKGFFKNSLNSQKYTCVEFFSIIWQNFMSNFSASENERLPFVQNLYNNSICFLINYFSKFKIQKMPKTTLIIGNSFPIKAAHLFWKK